MNAQKIFGGVIGVLSLTCPAIAQPRSYEQTATTEVQSVCTSLIGNEIEYQKPCTVIISQHIAAEGNFYVLMEAVISDEMSIPVHLWSPDSPNPRNCPLNPRRQNTFAMGGIERCLVESPRRANDLTREIPASEIEEMTQEERELLLLCFKPQNVNVNQAFCL